MWTTINRVLKNRAPWLQQGVKSALRACPLPLPKVVSGRWVLTHPALIGCDAEPHVVSWTEEVLQRGDTFIDVGAHVGWVALVASRRVGRDGSVVAFEPSPPLARLLRYQRRVNLAYNLTVEAAAVSNVSGTTALYLHNSGNSSVNSLIDAAVRYEGQGRSAPEALEVQAWSIDDYCQMARCQPRAVKIDVEGAELMVLRGAQEMMARYKPALILAVHPPLIPERKAHELFSLLDRHGYKIHQSHTEMHDGSLWGDYLCL
jgi:FkbM family methyltransferase